MKTEEFKLFAFGELKRIIGEVDYKINEDEFETRPLDYIDFDEHWLDIEVDQQLEIATKFGESKALLEQSRILNNEA
jgi:hypothetical protein